MEYKHLKFPIFQLTIKKSDDKTMFGFYTERIEKYIVSHEYHDTNEMNATLIVWILQSTSEKNNGNTYNIVILNDRFEIGKEINMGNTCLHMIVYPEETSFIWASLVNVMAYEKCGNFILPTTRRGTILKNIAEGLIVHFKIDVVGLADSSTLPRGKYQQINLQMFHTFVKGYPWYANWGFFKEQNQTEELGSNLIKVFSPLDNDQISTLIKALNSKRDKLKNENNENNKLIEQIESLAPDNLEWIQYYVNHQARDIIIYANLYYQGMLEPLMDALSNILELTFKNVEFYRLVFFFRRKKLLSPPPSHSLSLSLSFLIVNQ
jgi:hypothetical protein